MKTKKLLSVIAVLVLLLAALPVLSAGAAKADKVDVCHREGNGSFHTINVSENAVPAHLAHGDTLGPCPGPGPSVTPGYSGLTEEGSVRFRQQQGGNEIYLGKPDLGVGGNRVEAGCTWSDGTYPITFSYDGAGTISTTGNNNCSPTSLTYSVTPTCGAWNTMDILVVDRSDSTAIAFENVDLDGNTLGNFGTFDVAANLGFQNWTVADFDFSQPWTLSGDLRIQNFSGSAEKNKLQLTVGCLP